MRKSWANKWFAYHGKRLSCIVWMHTMCTYPKKKRELPRCNRKKNYFVTCFICLFDRTKPTLQRQFNLWFNTAFCLVRDSKFIIRILQHKFDAIYSVFWEFKAYNECFEIHVRHRRQNVFREVTHQLKQNKEKGAKERERENHLNLKWTFPMFDFNYYEVFSSDSFFHLNFRKSQRLQ